MFSKDGVLNHFFVMKTEEGVGSKVKVKSDHVYLLSIVSLLNAGTFFVSAVYHLTSYGDLSYFALAEIVLGLVLLLSFYLSIVLQAIHLQIHQMHHITVLVSILSFFIMAQLVLVIWFAVNSHQFNKFFKGSVTGRRFDKQEYSEIHFLILSIGSIVVALANIHAWESLKTCIEKSWRNDIFRPGTNNSFIMEGTSKNGNFPFPQIVVQDDKNAKVKWTSGKQKKNNRRNN